MNTLKQAKKGNASPDFSLIISRLEHAIIRGNDTGKTCRILSTHNIWKQLTTFQQIEWARLAQMAGEMETAINVLASVNKKEPGNVKAWQERMDLLAVLDRRSELAKVLARARPFMDKKTYKTQVHKLTALTEVEKEKDIESATGPFERLRHSQRQIDHFLKLFSGREDCFARQWVNRQEGKQGYVPVRSPMTSKDVEDHLNNRRTYGIYLLKADSNVSVGVMDADLISGFRGGVLKRDEKSQIQRERNYLISQIKEHAGKANLKPIVEFSGNKGYHFWFIFESPVPAGIARSVLMQIRDLIAPDLSAFTLEVFPKQDRLSGKGFGNLVKLPLGIHRLSGKKSYFLECRERSLEAQLNFLLKVKTSPVDGLRNFNAMSEKEKVLVHPRWQEWAEKYPELFILEKKCPPLAQIISSCRNGITLLPREEKIILQTIGFLSKAKTLIHYLYSFSSEYNPHLVDYKLSRVRGTPLGCRRIHSTLSFIGDMCEFGSVPDYHHPLLHIESWGKNSSAVKAEKAENLTSALENLKSAMDQVKRFME
ncbi:MAG: CRISPR-associated primase-polymerase type A1 [Thermodesulfobacteriota bacterium]|nr:CRISPR-associated primase-polymerase type A1 [Thermodesulfobacteriota bacterium]